MYDTFINQLFKLPNDTKIYPGHDYWENNLKFTLDREPENTKAKEMIEGALVKNPDNALISTIEIEKEINSFFRLKNVEIINKLRDDFPDLPINPSTKEVFLKLRELRNEW